MNHPCAHGFQAGCRKALGLARVPEWCQPCRRAYLEWCGLVLEAPCPLTEAQQQQYDCWLATVDAGRPAWSIEQLYNSLVEPGSEP